MFMGLSQGWHFLLVAASTTPHQATSPAPLTPYTEGVLIYAIIILVLVASLLIGAFVVVNYGMMSKRPDDYIGKRTPSEPGFFKGQMWPDEPYDEQALPADELGQTPQEPPEIEIRGPKRAA